jgi:hypothetical protein
VLFIGKEVLLFKDVLFVFVEFAKMIVVLVFEWTVEFCPVVFGVEIGSCLRLFGVMQLVRVKKEIIDKVRINLNFIFLIFIN